MKKFLLFIPVFFLLAALFGCGGANGGSGSGVSDPTNSGSENSSDETVAGGSTTDGSTTDGSSTDGSSTDNPSDQTYSIGGTSTEGIYADSSSANNELSLASIDDLNYIGAFRITTSTAYGDSSANYSYATLAYNSDNKSIFLAGHNEQGSVAEFAIPELVNSTDLDDLNDAGAPIQYFTNVVDRATITKGEGIRISGMYYYNNKLMVNVYRFYDQAEVKLQTPMLIFDDASDIANSSIRGYLTVNDGVRGAGWVSYVPTEWQSVLGGTHISGLTSSTGRANVYSASVGPVAYSFNADDYMDSASSDAVDNTPLLYYTLANNLAGSIEGLYDPGHPWTHYSEGSFGMIIPGTRTYIMLGKSGGHVSGMSYGDPPYGGYKGHYTLDEYDRYPYYWLYDITGFEKVAAGEMEPGELVPYAWGKFDAPFQTDDVYNKVAGGSYDQQNGILYLSIYKADMNSYGANAPVIAAYKFDVEE